MSKKKNDFQDGGCGGHFGFPVNTILTILYLVVGLLLHHKFRLNSQNGLRGDVENRFSKIDLQEGGYGGHFGFSISRI